jgi:hypothetical protein
MHLLRYRQIQSEMQTVLFEKPSPAYAPIDLSQWQQQMHDRIQVWYNNVPRSNNQTDLERKVIDNFELTLHRALFYLYHPSRNIPFPSESALVKVTEAATHMIQLYRRFFREHRLTIYWQAVENLSSAGTTLMFCYVNSAQVRERLMLRALESLVHICSSVLWGMVEHFPAFKGKRDAFDLTASKILADINNSSAAVEGTESLFMRGTISTAGEHIDRQANVGSAPSAAQQSVQQVGSEADQAEQPHTTSSFATADNRGQDQVSQFSLPVTGCESPTYVAQAPFSFPDFDEAAFNWGVLENSTESFTPVWL